MQPTDECECREILTAVENFSQLVLKVADIELEAITLPHFDGEEVVVVLVGFPMGGVLSESVSLPPRSSGKSVTAVSRTNL